MSRYIRDDMIGNLRFGTTNSIERIRRAHKNGAISTRRMVLKSGQRLDTIAGAVLGDSSLWWTIAALSGIGWGLQVPPGTRLIVPVTAAEVEDFV
jgi:hypothetical protein